MHNMQTYGCGFQYKDTGLTVVTTPHVRPSLARLRHPISAVTPNDGVPWACHMPLGHAACACSAVLLLAP
jgi:hypothetical protein